MSNRLSKEFFAQDTIVVARQLIGKELVHRDQDGTLFAGRIVETEAYLGLEDPSCHSFGGRRTPRTEVMFGDPGFSYVYFIYGMHHCFNVVTMARGVPEAVLVRAVELAEHPFNVANGPGKLCRAMRLNRSHNRLDLTQSENLWIQNKDTVPDEHLIEGPRVGIGYAHDAVFWPLRFGLRNSPALSLTQFLQYTA